MQRLLALLAEFGLIEALLAQAALGLTVAVVFVLRLRARAQVRLPGTPYGVPRVTEPARSVAISSEQKPGAIAGRGVVMGPGPAMASGCLGANRL